MKNPTGSFAPAPPLGRRARLVPILSTLAGSALAALPVIAPAAVLPPCGLLMATAWRLLRPELWQAWVALPLGLADDLLTGQPLGSGMALWTLVFLAVDRVDARLPWRDHWLDWAIAAPLLAFCIVGGLVAAGVGLHDAPDFLPQMAMTIFCFPLAQRVAAALDRWRLR